MPLCSMKSHSRKTKAAFTLTETILYIGLLSGVMTVLVPFVWMINEQSLRLIRNIETHE